MPIIGRKTTSTPEQGSRPIQCRQRGKGDKALEMALQAV